MLRKDSDKPSGYDYPNPSIDRGQTQTPDHPSLKPLSRENAEKIREAVHRQHAVTPRAK